MTGLGPVEQRRYLEHHARAAGPATNAADEALVKYGRMS